MKQYKFLKYCPEHYQEIENYELAKSDNFVGWVCHHRNGEEFPKKWLIKNKMYYNRKDPHEFKFLKESEHKRLHQCGKPSNRLGHKGNKYSLSEETKQRISKAKLGHKVSLETRRKLSELAKLREARKRGEVV